MQQLPAPSMPEPPAKPSLWRRLLPWHFDDHPRPKPQKQPDDDSIPRAVYAD
ncbi:MAG TPA: hypothetical protein VND64_14095 [Pirellulales bacterium]|nr:hypothetical protein [Pirellulales bacterium]